MDIRQLRQFLVVADTLNFTRAAERLHMSGPPLSRSIMQLEKRIGGPLFERGTRHVELTPLGRMLLPYAQRVSNDFEVLERELVLRSKDAQVVDLGFRSIPQSLLTRILSAFAGSITPEPVIRLHPMDSMAQFEQLETGRLGLALVGSMIEPERFGYLPILSERLAFALPDRSPYADLTEVSPEDIRELLLLIQPGVSIMSQYMRPYVQAVHQVEHIDFEIVGGIAALIAQGGACCITSAHPETPWNRYLTVEGVTITPCPDEVPSYITYLSWRLDRDRPHDLGPLIQAARNHFDGPAIF